MNATWLHSKDERSKISDNLNRCQFAGNQPKMESRLALRQCVIAVVAAGRRASGLSLEFTERERVATQLLDSIK